MIDKGAGKETLILKDGVAPDLRTDSLGERGTALAHADLPLILILSVYTDFLPFKFGKIRIFFLKIWENTDFFQE